MIRPMYAIRDIKAGYLTPMVDINDDVAKRNFANAVVNNPTTCFYSNPEDFALFKIGEYDDDIGVIIPMDKVLIVEASQLLRKKD